MDHRPSLARWCKLSPRGVRLPRGGQAFTDKLTNIVDGAWLTTMNDWSPFPDLSGRKLRFEQLLHMQRGSPESVPAPATD